MRTDSPELTASETEALRRIDAGLRRRLGGIALNEQFDERVLARVRELGAAQLAAKRAQAEQQYARWSDALARQWRSARHVLIAKLAAFTTAAIVLGVALRNALAQALISLSDGYLAQIGAAAQLPWIALGIAVATVALGWGVSTRVKL